MGGMAACAVVALLYPCPSGLGWRWPSIWVAMVCVPYGSGGPAGAWVGHVVRLLGYYCIGKQALRHLHIG